MEKINTENEYIRCDIVTGRLYRCLTSLFQEFLDVQFSEALGPDWMNAIVKLAENISGPDMSQERNSLSTLLKKRDEKGLVLMDKTCIDVTIANTLMRFTCYYLVSVPRYCGFKKADMVGIICAFEGKPESAYENYDTTALREKLMDCIRADITVVLKCQDKMAKRIPRNGREERKKNGKIEGDDFYKKIDRLVNNKNRLNSHMSIVNDSIASELEITDTIMHLEEFLKYLDKTWEYQMKDEFLAKYRKEINIIRYLRNATQFDEVMTALNSIINAMPVEKPANKTEEKTKEECHLNEFMRCFSLLSNANNHCAACTALKVESDSLKNPCATIMLAFMYYCGWVSGHTAEEILMPISMISDPAGWLVLAESLKKRSKEKEKEDAESSIMDRTQSIAYYIGHAMMNNDTSAFMMAAYLGIMLENFEITKACFQYAGESDQTAKNYYNAFNSMHDEIAFQKWASEQNRRRLDK